MGGNPNIDSEQALIEQIINKDEDAINNIFPALRNKIRFFLWGQKKLSGYSLEELVNETFIEVFQCKVPQLNCLCLTYLTKIAKNIWFKKQRKIKEIPLPTEDLESISSKTPVFEETRIEDHLLDTAKSCLPYRSQAILYYYSQGYDPSSASKLLGFSSKEVYLVRKTESLKELKKIYFHLRNEINKQNEKKTG